MLKMRLQRIGRKNDASFRLVVTDSRRGPKSGKHIDLIGSYNPKLNRVQFDAEKIKKWIANGVQVSDTVHNLLVSQKIIDGKKRNVLPKKSPIISESSGASSEASEAPAAEVAASETETSAEEAGEASAPAEEKPAEEGEKESDKPTEESPAEESKEEDTQEASDDAETAKEETSTEESAEETKEKAATENESTDESSSDKGK